MEKFKTLNDLNLQVKKDDEVLVSEGCCTALTICLNNDGDVFTSFVGAYNPEIIKLLRKVQKTYYKKLIKRLKKENRDEVNNLTKKADVTEDITPKEPVKKEKVKKVHERDLKAETKQTKEKSDTKQTKTEQKANLNKEKKSNKKETANEKK